MTDITIYIIVALSVLGVFQLFYWGFFMFRVSRKRSGASVRMPLSVVVCAKNEEFNLLQLVPMLCSQDYPEFQVVVVDDCSTDDTAITLARFKAQYPNFYYTSIPVDLKFHHGKKLAISIGIKAAKYEHMVFIDADCRPCSNLWLEQIAGCFADGEKQLVLGYGKYAKEPGLLNRIIRYETFWNAVQYIGFAKAWRPFMGVGRNLAYTKTLFNQSSKFRNNLNILSGDDDMFVSEMGTRSNVGVCSHLESQTVSEPEHTLGAWIRQKGRHLTTAVRYPSGVRMMLGLQELTRQLHFFATIAALVYGDEVVRIVAASIWFVRQVVMHVSLAIAQKRMSESGLWPFTLFMDIIVPWMQLVCYLWGNISKHRDTWN